MKPLPLPADRAIERLDENASVALFAQRARQVRTDFTLDGDTGDAVARICRRVDGLPSRSSWRRRESMRSRRRTSCRRSPNRWRRSPAPGAMRPRQRRFATRSTELRPASPDEQHLFRNLAVFVGGFSLEAANAIATDSSKPPATQAVADLIATLVDHSLIERVETSERTRFRMLETIASSASPSSRSDELTAACTGTRRTTGTRPRSPQPAWRVRPGGLAPASTPNTATCARRLTG